MNIVKNDYSALLGRLSIAADREFTDPQSVELVARFRELGWEGSCRVVEAISSSANIPRNLYGFTLNAIKEEFRYLIRQQHQREQWKIADADRATQEEFCLTMRVIGLLTNFENSADLLFKFGEFMENAVTQNNLLEQLKRAESFYSDMIKKGAKLKSTNAVSFLR